MKKVMNTAVLVLLVNLIMYGQQSIDGTINFQTDPSKKYSVYIPSEYDENVGSPAFLALHPLNTRRWNAKSWRDTLITFAETNDLILICPDGGADGRIDDPIDTAFTTFLLDSMERAYNIVQNEIYVIGFSWGARTTYTYGLRRSDRFRGYIPLGAAITNLIEIGPVVANAEDEAIYIIHGSNDSPASRFYPARDALIAANACVKDTLLPGVGHTVDFPGRNALLTEAYGWLKSQNCGSTASQNIEDDHNDWPLINPISSGAKIVIPQGLSIINVVDQFGKPVPLSNDLQLMHPGIYFIVYKNAQTAVRIKRLVVQ